jgi:hypothetical protein
MRSWLVPNLVTLASSNLLPNLASCLVESVIGPGGVMGLGVPWPGPGHSPGLKPWPEPGLALAWPWPQPLYFSAPLILPGGSQSRSQWYHRS